MRQQRGIPYEALHDYYPIPRHGYTWPAPPRASLGQLAWSLLARAVALVRGRR